jgi:hypothetical protein
VDQGDIRLLLSESDFGEILICDIGFDGKTGVVDRSVGAGARAASEKDVARLFKICVNRGLGAWHCHLPACRRAGPLQP